MLVELKNMKKAFGEVIALNKVDFSVREGTIHGLLGENGAGKTVLMNILYGLYSQDQGEIYLDGKKVTIHSPYDSIRLGIGMVHQISTLVPEFTAIENIMLGTKSGKYVLLLDQEKKKIEKMSNNLGLTFPLEVKVEELPAGIKQKIEIIRALYRRARLLILDEPTTSLVESEFQQLFKSLQVLVKKGVTVIFITHKIREIMQVCDSVTILRKGEVKGLLTKEEMSKEKLVKLMFIEKDIEVTESALPQVELPLVHYSAKPVVVAKNISVEAREKSPGLRNVSFGIYGGEILGVAAVSGNGEKELAAVMINSSSLTSGDILVNDERINNLPTLDIFSKGVFYTPEDRIKEGILPEGSIKENVLLGHHSEKRFLKNRIFIDWNETRNTAQKIIKDYNVDTPNEEIAIRRLSGGNIEKIIIGRAFVNPITFLVTHNPTSGLDFSAVEFIFKKLVETRNAGAAILWINEDLDELMIISDRIAVLHQGKIRGIVKRDEFDKYKIGLLMIGEQN